MSEMAGVLRDRHGRLWSLISEDVYECGRTNHTLGWLLEWVGPLENLETSTVNNADAPDCTRLSKILKVLSELEPGSTVLYGSVGARVPEGKSQMCELALAIDSSGEASFRIQREETVRL